MTESDNRIMEVWHWCHDSYLQNGNKISFPKHTDPRQTYQWQYLRLMVQKFDEWHFDADTSKKFINVAIGLSKKRGTMMKGLAALHQSNLLETCHSIIIKEEQQNTSQLSALADMKEWFDAKVGEADPLEALLARSNRNSFPNIVLWYKSNRLSELFIALSKSCCKAINRIEAASEKQLLPTFASSYVLRMRFLDGVSDVTPFRNIFGNDWRVK